LNTVQKIVLYSAGGGNDTIFAFLANPGNNDAQIWKTSKTNIAWTMVVQLPAYSYLRDAIVYNDSIYFARFDSWTGKSYVYRMNGNGDTIVTHASPGINDPSNDVRCFMVHNGFLYAGTHNYSVGANLLKYSTATSWIAVNQNGFGFSYNLANIQQLYYYRNKFWAIGVGQDGAFDHGGARVAGNNQVQGGPATVQLLVSPDGVNFRQCATAGFRNYSNFGDTWRMSSLGDYMYAAGNNYNTAEGEMWRSSVPLADFTTEFGATCAGMPENYTNTSVNAFSYKWYVNGSLISTALNTSYVYPSPGTYTISLVAYSADTLYSDSLAVLKTVTSALNLAANSTSICEDNVLQLGTTIVGLSGGTTPYTYNWTDGTNIYSGANPSHLASASSTFTLSVTDVHSCVTTQTLSVNVNPSTDLHGHVSTPASFDVDNGEVYVFIHQPGSAALDTVGHTSLDANGDYLFTPLAAGDYLIKVLPDETDFPNGVPTYYGDAFQWDSSVVYTHGCMQTDTADIEIVEALNTPGTASISGYILEGDGYGTARYGIGHQPNLPFIPGGPLKGIDVKLGKNPGGGIQARVNSDTTGFYEFQNVPPGGYKIYVDIPNLPMDSTRELTIAATDSSVQNNYYADSVMIYVIDTTIIAPVGIYTSAKLYENQFRIYPNPAQDNMYLSYELKQASQVSFEITDAMGRMIRKEPYRNFPGGKNIFIFNARQLDLKAGVYFVSILPEGTRYTQRIVVIE
jgi:hypothetical protein